MCSEEMTLARGRGCRCLDPLALAAKLLAATSRFPPGRYYHLRVRPFRWGSGFDCMRIAMRVGVPREVKPDEYRIAMMPVGVELLKKNGHEVLVETQAGAASGF